MAFLIYVLAFLVGFVVLGGITGAGVLVWIDRLKDPGFAFIIILLVGIGVSIAAGIAGGCLAVIAVGIRRGQTLQALGIVFVLLALLALLWVARDTIGRWYAKTPAQVEKHRQGQQRQQEYERRERFFGDYGRFLRAAGAGNREIVESLLDAGMPYVAVSATATPPTHNREWAERVIEASDIQQGLSIFRLSGLEIAAWYGHTEIVDLLLARQTGTPEQKARLRQNALHYAQKYQRTETIALLEHIGPTT